MIETQTVAPSQLPDPRLIDTQTVAASRLPDPRQIIIGTLRVAPSRSKASYDRDPESCIQSTARSNVNYDRDPDSSFIIVLFPLPLLTKR